MAKPRIFISSTFYDLRQVRADLERFIKEMGYESVRNETGSIPYGKDLKLEEYCYREISGIDILVGIIGGRFGSVSGKSNYSITQTEIKTALEQNKNVYLFIDKNVHSEYQTYLINKENKKTQYRYADDIKIYQFIEEVFALPKNNIIQSFETAQDIISFLREQWAGLLKDLLTQDQNRNNYENISGKVNELNEVSSTLQTYLENVLKSVNADNSNEVISKEQHRLQKLQLIRKIEKLNYINHLIRAHDVETEEVVEILNKVNNLSELKNELNEKSTLNSNDDDEFTYSCMFEYENIEDLNEARRILSLPEFEISKNDIKIIEDDPDYLKELKSKFSEEKISNKNRGRKK
jgi:hypothetical protein